jgi:TonB family protein
MLNALEDDPDEQNRWQRLAVGGGIAAFITAAAVYTANTYAPARELMKRVVHMTIQTAPPPPDDKPLPPLPPPPPPKPQPKKAENKQQDKAPAPKPDANPTPADPTQVGMDAESFGAGGSGPGFHVGGNQMGDPNVAAPVAAPKPIAAAPKAARATKYLMAKPLGQDNVSLLFSKRARQMGLSGLMLIELALDEKGKVHSAKVRKGLESVFDAEVLKAVKGWLFEPPGSAAIGEAVADVRMLRLRFSLVTN